MDKPIQESLRMRIERRQRILDSCDDNITTVMSIFCALLAGMCCLGIIVGVTMWIFEVVASIF